MLGDWFYWLIGGLLGAAGAILALWSLFADRARSRKRCPKCWYDMSGAAGDPPYTCPECGNVIKREKRLYKTRRRWRWTMVTVVVLVGSAALALTPKVRRDGVASVTPTTALILSHHYEWSQSATLELIHRIAETDAGGSLQIKPERLTEWQWSLWAGAAVKTLSDKDCEIEWDDACWVLRTAADAGIPRPEGFTDLVVCVVEQPDAWRQPNTWAHPVARGLHWQGIIRWLDDDSERVYRALLRGLHSTACPKAAWWFTKDALQYGGFNRACDDLMDIIPTMQNEACTAEAAEEFLFNIFQEDDAGEKMINEDAFLDGMIRWLSSNTASARGEGQATVWAISAMDEDRVRDALEVARESDGDKVNYLKIEKTLRLISESSEDVAPGIMFAGEPPAQRQILERLWQIDREFCKFCMDRYCEDSHVAFFMEHAAWLNAVGDPKFSAEFLSSVIEQTDPICAMNIAVELDQPSAEIAGVLERLSKVENEWVRDKAREALDRMTDGDSENEEGD